MSREIRFRVWDKKNNRMFNDCFELTNRGYLQWVQLNQSSDDLEWMQFTGLTDKNGKEIYEGDIVTTKQSYIKPIAVYWNDAMTGFYPLLSERGDKLEVIGNIHQDAQLLK